MGAIEQILPISQQIVDEFLLNFSEKWDVSIAANISSFVLMWITIRIKEF